MRIDGSTQNTYERLSTAKRINRASDDPAGLAILQKLQEQTRGLNKATDNALSMNDLSKTADGALSSMHDSLQRMRELAVQAQNGILTDSDRAAIQEEIGEIKQSISSTVQNTQFNTQKLLDGTFTDKNIAINPNGTGMKMNVQNTGLEALGIDSFDVTGSFDISDIDSAISKVSEARSELGATSNRITHGVNVNNISEYNITAANSRIEDLDMASAMVQLSTQQILQQYNYYAQKQTYQQKANSISLLG